MRYYKQIENGYIIGVGTGFGDTEISQAEYDDIMALIKSCPTPPEGYEYHLLADSLLWQQRAAAPISEDVQSEI